MFQIPTSLLVCPKHAFPMKVHKSFGIDGPTLMEKHGHQFKGFHRCIFAFCRQICKHTQGCIRCYKCQIIWCEIIGGRIPIGIVANYIATKLSNSSIHLIFSSIWDHVFTYQLIYTDGLMPSVLTKVGISTTKIL